MIQRKYARSTYVLVLLAALALLAAACGGRNDSGQTGGGALAGGVADLTGVRVSVGSKEFTEQRIVGHMAALALEAAGASVNRSAIGVEGTEVIRQLLETGQVDMYWEYTGTGWITILGMTEILDGAEAYHQRVKEADAENGIVWLPPSEVNNTYAFFVSPNAGLGVETISDLAALARQSPDRVTLCAAAEFAARPDGLPGVTNAYDFAFSRVSESDLPLAINEAIKGQRCTVGEIFQTNPQILQRNLNVLEDDRQFFPVYNLAMTIRREVYEANAQGYNELFGAITELLDNDTMIRLNSAVEIDLESEEDVAREFLVEHGIISG